MKHLTQSWNIIEKIIEGHRAWHFLFNNRLICEAMEMIRKRKIKKHYYVNRDKVDRKEKEKIKARERAYRILFGDALSEKAIKIIIEHWTPEHPKGQCFQHKECFKFHNPEKVCPLLRLK